MTNSGNSKFFNNTIPYDWNVKRLGEIINIKSGLGFNASEYSKQGIRLLQIEHVGYGKIEWNSNFFLPESYLDKFKDVVLHENDIVLALNRPVTNNQLKIAILKKSDAPAILYQRVGKIILKDSNQFPLYLFYNFSETIKKHVERKSIGSDQPFISVISLYKEKVFLPALPEQKTIAHVLGLMDTAINTNNQLIAQKELRKKWLMQNLLTGKKRLKGFNKEWKEIHIRDVSKEVSIKNKADKQLTVLSCTKYDGLVPSLEYFGRKIFADDVSTYKIVPKNHFAYATNHIEEGSIGYQEIFDEALISPMYTVFKTDSSINDTFFYKLLKSHKLVYQYQNRMEGSIDRRGGLRWDTFSIIKIHIPSFEEQTAIAQVLQAIDKEIQLLKTKTERLKEQKKWMMQVLLTGKKRLKV